MFGRTIDGEKIPGYDFGSQPDGAHDESPCCQGDTREIFLGFGANSLYINTLRVDSARPQGICREMRGRDNIIDSTVCL